MKTVITLFILLVILASFKAKAALPPTTLGGQATTAKPTTFNYKAPNFTATQTNGTESLIETGNSNILANPSFEHQTLNSGWTIGGTSGIGGFNSSVVVHGSKSWFILPSASTVDIKQSSTLYQAQFADGVQGLAYCRIKSDVALNFCSINAGVVSTTNCVAVNTDSKWGLYKLPISLGGTSNGLSIASSGNVTGSVYVDDCFLGAVDLKQDVDQSRVAGYAFFAGTSGCTWSRTSTTIGAFTTTAACPGPTVSYSSMGSWQTTDSDLPRVTVNNLPAGVYKATFTVQQFNAATTTPAFAINDGTTTCQSQGATEAATGGSSSVVCIFTYTSSGNRVFELYGGSASSTMTVRNDNNTSGGINSKFMLEYFGSGSNYTASCGASCEDVLSFKVSTTGVVSDETQDFINGNCAITSTSIYTCTFNSGIFTVAPICQVAVAAGGTIIGLVNNAGTTSSQVQVETRVPSTGSNAVAALNVTCQKTGADFKATRNIVGSFNEVVTKPGVSKPVTYRADVSSADAVTNETFDFINGNCTDATTGQATCLFNSSAFSSGSIVRCHVQELATSSGNDPVRCSPTANPTTTSAIVLCKQAAVSLNYGFTIFCEGLAP